MGTRGAAIALQPHCASAAQREHKRSFSPISAVSLPYGYSIEANKLTSFSGSHPKGPTTTAAHSRSRHACTKGGQGFDGWRKKGLYEKGPTSPRAPDRFGACAGGCALRGSYNDMPGQVVASGRRYRHTQRPSHRRALTSLSPMGPKLLPGRQG